MTLAALILGSVIFIEGFLFLELGKQPRAILAVARDALRVLGDAHRGDDEKERCARRASRLLLAATGAMVLKLAAIAAALLLFFAGTARLFPESGAGLVAALTSPFALVLVTVAAAGYVWVRNALLRQV